MRIKNNKRLIKLILKKSREICKSLKKRKKQKRGRPPLYEDHIIVSALLIKTLKGLVPLPYSRWDRIWVWGAISAQAQEGKGAEGGKVSRKDRGSCGSGKG